MCLLCVYCVFMATLTCLGVGAVDIMYMLTGFLCFMECHCDWGVGQSVPLGDVVDGSVS